jgi:hypothetical protein
LSCFRCSSQCGHVSESTLGGLNRPIELFRRRMSLSRQGRSHPEH